MTPRRVDFVYEGEGLVVIDKPSGLPTVRPEGSRAKSAYDYVTERIRRRNPKGRAAVVHRLDRDSSGLVVFAMDARGKAELMGAWDELVLERRYLALIEGALPEPEGVMEDWLYEPVLGRVRVGAKGDKGVSGNALLARMHYRVVERGPAYSLVELSLETGRKHQIRAQLAARGCPIAGDGRYGAHSDPAGRLCLHAAVLALMPRRGAEPLRFESPAPASFRKALGLKRLEGRAQVDERRWPGKSPRAGGFSPRDTRRDGSGARPEGKRPRRGEGPDGPRPHKSGRGDEGRAPDAIWHPGRPASLHDQAAPKANGRPGPARGPAHRPDARRLKAAPERKAPGSQPPTGSQGPRKSSSRKPTDTRRRP